SVFSRRENGRAARGSEDDRGLVTLHVNNRFDRAAIWFVFPYDFHQSIADRDQTRGRTHGTCVANRSEIERTRFAIIRIDNCNTGVAKRSVDGEHAHYRHLKIARRVFNTESTKSQTAVLLAPCSTLCTKEPRRINQRTSSRPS